MLHALAEDSVPALMHCAAGKDRAGLSIAVTLLAVGVEREAIVADYLESNAQHRRYKVRRSATSADGLLPRGHGAAQPRCSTRAPSTSRRPSRPSSRPGARRRRYLEEGLGLTPETRERLRDRLLD